MTAREPSFAEIADAIGLQAQWAAETAENVMGLVAKVNTPGVVREYHRVRRHAAALGAAHAIFVGLARYEREVHRLLKLSKRYAGRQRFRWWPFVRAKREEGQWP